MNYFNNIIWTYFFLPGVIICGGILSIGCGFMQFRRFGLSLRLTVGKAFTKHKGDGISPLQAASTALASTVGTGNIVGTAQAICMGGPGAVFWMWVAAFFGMIIKYAEIFLSLRFREKTEDGYIGGPMQYIIKGIGSRYAPLASAYAAFAALSAIGTGNLAQINGSISAFTAAVSNFTTLSNSDMLYLRLFTGLVLALLLYFIMSGGAKGVGRATEIIVPFMSLGFIMISVIVLICHAQQLPGVLHDIVNLAINPKAAAGAAGGLGIKEAMHWGIRRSAFSNEAGLGSSAIAHAQVSAESDFEHAMWGIFEVFADTVVICSATAFCILASGISIPWGSTPGPELLLAAFSTVFGQKLSTVFMAAAMLLFGYATVIGWSLYGCSCITWLFGVKALPFYRTFFLVCLILGCVMSTEAIWTFADTANALMSIPNLAAVFSLSGFVCREIRRELKKIQ